MTGMMKLLKTFAVQKFRYGVLKRWRVISLLLVSTPEGWIHFFCHPGACPYAPRRIRVSRSGRGDSVFSQRPQRSSERSGIQAFIALVYVLVYHGNNVFSQRPQRSSERSGIQAFIALEYVLAHY